MYAAVWLVWEGLASQLLNERKEGGTTDLAPSPYLALTLTQAFSRTQRLTQHFNRNRALKFFKLAGHGGVYL